MPRKWELDRRTFLRGLGTAVALPVLDAMLPSINRQASAAAASGIARQFPTRMAFVYLPNGVNTTAWLPEKTGSDYQLSPTLAPLAGHQKEILVIDGLSHGQADGMGDTGGGHARACGTYLTACHPKKTAGADIRAGISVDQVAANKIGDLTRFPSLELSCDKGQESGACDSGYSCAYQFNISWRSPSQPMNPEVEPQLVFNRLFGAGPDGESAEVRIKRQTQDRSVLDFVSDHAKNLQGKLGTNDRRKLDEYFTAIREVEKRIAKNGIAPPTIPDENVPNFNADYSFERHMRLTFDIMTLAFQTDSTRVATFLVGHDQSNRPFPFINAPGGHHSTSHHRNQEESLARLARIDHFHTQQFAYFLDRLKGITEGEGTLLDNCMITYGAGLRDGNAHSNHYLPMVLAGRGGGTISPGRSIHLENEQPMANLFMSMLDRIGAPVARFGDSTGKFEEIA